jgi:glucosamine--fructose-6-phosphate aminotransferase (isomerizing)
MHGPITLLNNGSTVVLIASQARMFDDINQLIAKVKRYGVRIFGISDNREILKQVDIKMPVCEGLPEWLFPIVSIIPGQLMSLGLARAKKLDPDHPK